jgi:hypothetical protein
MASRLSPKQSEFSADLASIKPSIDANFERPAWRKGTVHALPDGMIRAADLNSKRPSLGKRAARALARFLIMFCIGVAATLAWQSYGDAAREMIASSSPQLSWLAPQAAPLAQTVPDMVAPAAAATPSPDLQQLKAMSLDLAAVRQSVDQLAAQLAAGQQQMAGDIAKLQAEISAPPPRPAAAPARKPVPQTPLPSSQAPPVR